MQENTHKYRRTYREKSSSANEKTAICGKIILKSERMNDSYIREINIKLHQPLSVFCTLTKILVRTFSTNDEKQTIVKNQNKNMKC